MKHFIFFVLNIFQLLFMVFVFSFFLGGTFGLKSISKSCDRHGLVELGEKLYLCREVNK